MMEKGIIEEGLQGTDKACEVQGRPAAYKRRPSKYRRSVVYRRRPFM